MLELIKLGANCLFKYTNGQVSTPGDEPSSAKCLRIDLEATIEYAPTLKTTLHGYTFISLWKFLLGVYRLHPPLLQ